MSESENVIRAMNKAIEESKELMLLLENEVRCLKTKLKDKELEADCIDDAYQNEINRRIKQESISKILFVSVVLLFSTFALGAYNYILNCL